MPFATDRDLLTLEPNLFRDLAWVGQRLSRGSASISGATLTCSSPEIAFDAAGITTGHVVTIGGVSYEVLARLSATQLTISRIRPDTSAAAIPPTPVTNTEAWVVTFAPQIAVVHSQALRMLGIEPQAATRRPAEPDITNPQAFTRLEALGALHLIYAAAGAVSALDTPPNQRAALYRALFREERARTAAEIDLNNDGEPDTTRRLNVTQFVR